MHTEAVDVNIVDLENGKAFVEKYKDDRFEYIQTCFWTTCFLSFLFY